MNKATLVQACNVLRDIGSKKSLPVLEKAAKQKEKDVAKAAAAALDGVKDREK